MKRRATGSPRGPRPAPRGTPHVERAGEDTRIVMRAVFPTKELREEAVDKYHAIEGGEQTLSNLAAYVAELTRDESSRNEPTPRSTPKGAEG